MGQIDKKELLDELFGMIDAVNRPVVNCSECGQRERILTALMDLRDEFIARQPRSEWVKNKVAQGIEKGIEMAIEKVREMEDVK